MSDFQPEGSEARRQVIAERERRKELRRRALREPVSALEGMAFVFGALFALACVRWWPVLFAIVGAAG